MYKNLLRQKMLARRLELSPQDAETSADIIAKRLSIFLNYRNAKTVMCYTPIKGEVNTMPIVKMCLDDGKRVVLPVIDNGVIRPCVFTSYDNLSNGKFNILEPSEKDYVSPLEIDLVCVPGLAFNQGKYRIGFGGGYYDRFLPELSEDCFKVGIAYDFQVVKVLPIEIHDVILDMIITDKQFIGDRSF